MKGGKYLRIALPTPLRRLFDYLPPQSTDLKNIIPGVRVRVPFQRRTLIGIVVDITATTTVPLNKLKTILDVLDTTPLLPADIDKLCAWAADYYHYALGEVLMAALPTLLRKGEQPTVVEEPTVANTSPQLPLILNAAQANALSAIQQSVNTFKTILIDGVTGSGKTEVYLQAITHCLSLQQQVLVLVPEISLTPQTVSRFGQRFNVPIATWHSGMTEKARLQAWLAARSGAARIIIGTRSAIFTPFEKLGLIIVDEEHDTSFKQQDHFRYHARDLSIMRANILSIPVVLGSATPSLETLLNVNRQRYLHMTLPERAGNATMPTYHLVNIAQHKLREGISEPLLQAMRKNLDDNNQVLLFLNRRGFAPVLYCTECGWIADCKRCDCKFIYHQKPLRLQCHHCDVKKEIPVHCEKCQQPTLLPVGIGTQRLEKMLSDYFIDVPIIRIDRDSTRKKKSLHELFTQVNEQPRAILIGTQMLAKGHHFSNVTLVGVVDADGGLFSADFRAAEQMGQLITQVAGRAGRENKQGNVIIQTRHPEHPLLKTLVQEGYAAYAKLILAEREQAFLPPFSYFAVFRAEAYTENNANQFLSAIKKVGDAITETVSVLGPVPTLLAKRKGLYCQQLIVRSNRRSALQHFLTEMVHQVEKLAATYPVKWTLDVDPLEVV